jgi:WD40 repeat protein
MTSLTIDWSRHAKYRIPQGEWSFRFDFEVSYGKVLSLLTFPLRTPSTALAFSPADHLLAAGFGDGSLRVFSARKSHRLLAVVEHHRQTVAALVWGEVGGRSLLFVCTSEGQLSIWNLYNDPVKQIV